MEVTNHRREISTVIPSFSTTMKTRTSSFLRHRTALSGFPGTNKQDGCYKRQPYRFVKTVYKSPCRGSRVISTAKAYYFHRRPGFTSISRGQLVKEDAAARNQRGRIRFQIFAAELLVSNKQWKPAVRCHRSTQTGTDTKRCTLKIGRQYAARISRNRAGQWRNRSRIDTEIITQDPLRVPSLRHNTAPDLVSGSDKHLTIR